MAKQLGKISPDFINLNPDYVDLGFAPLLKRRAPVFRFDGYESRFYYTFDRHGAGKPHISITSLSDKVLPKGAAFANWLKKYGEESDKIKFERAVFGTVFHRECMRPILADDPIHGAGYDFDALDEPVLGNTYINDRGDECICTRFHMMFPAELRAKASSWRMPFKKGLMSWFWFLKNDIARIYAVELPLVHKRWEIGGTADMIADVIFRTKERRSIIDIKSFLMDPEQGIKKAFYDTHEFQLAGLKFIWESQFPEYPIEMLFNWSPNAWVRGVPTYELKNQTDNRFLKTIRTGNKTMSTFEMRFLAAKMEGILKPPTNVADIYGKMESLESFNYEGHYREIKLI